MGARFEAVKTHVKDNRHIYIALGIVILAGSTYLILRGNPQRLLFSRSSSVAANRSSSVIGETTVSNFSPQRSIFGDNNINLTQIIDSHRQGAPSWVIRCKETNDVFTSQRSAAQTLGLSESRLSSHLNGMRDHVDGLHFERLAMAA